MKLRSLIVLGAGALLALSAITLATPSASAVWTCVDGGHEIGRVACVGACVASSKPLGCKPESGLIVCSGGAIGPYPFDLVCLGSKNLKAVVE